MNISDQSLPLFTIYGLAFSVSAIDRSIAWYESVLGFKLIGRTEFSAINARGAFLEGAGIRIELLEPANSFRIAEMFADPPAHILPVGNKAMILYVKDLHGLSPVLESQGVNIAFKELDMNNDGLLCTVIKDPDGNFISILGEDIYQKFFTGDKP